jgi:RNA polymerase sigma-70 factor (ECF subfamily)
MAERDAAPDDLADVRRAVADRRAFEPLYRRHVGPVYRLCLRRLRDEQAAQDATSLTFMKAMDALPAFRGGSFRSWINTIAERTCLDLIRRQRPQAAIDTELELASPAAGPEQRAVESERDRELALALSQLSPRRAEIVRLRLEGFTGPEIAASLGLSHESVRQEQRRALLQLADLLEAHRDD